MKDFYLNLSSISSVFKTNTASEFSVAVRPEINLSGNWSVALVEMLLPKATLLKPKYFLASFIESSIVGETRRSVLRVIFNSNQHLNFNPEYIPVRDHLLDTLCFELVDDKGNIIPLTGETHIRLHFTKW